MPCHIATVCHHATFIHIHAIRSDLRRYARAMAEAASGASAA